ncbi:MAG: chromosomal replication initiator protein DnaA [Thermodesulfobacteriota bacterium]
MDSEALWKECLDGLSRHVSTQHFSTWFRPITVSPGEAGDSLTLNVPNRFFLEWIKEHYLPLIHEVLRRSSGRECKITWRLEGEGETRAPRAEKKAAPKKRAARKAAPLPGLNPKYTFDNFIIGKDNQFAHAACSAVAGKRSTKYNPLFIYGGVGLGKTHLLQAIGNSIYENDPSTRVCYYTSERFMNNFISYISRQKMKEFRGKFRNVDVLLIDDIQFWAGKERTQEEFFHTFNALHEKNKQIVVTSDSFPKEITGLEERLRSRFEWGLVADIQPPDMETKVAIIRKKAADEGQSLPDDVAVWLASVSGSNIRELEGFLNRIIAVSSLTDKEITLPMSKDALKNLLRETEERIISIDEIQKAVSVLYNVKPADLKSKSRHRTVSFPRQIAMFLARKYGNFSFPEIGSAFGGKDHSTAIHAVKKIEKTLKGSAELRNSIKKLKKELEIP